MVTRARPVFVLGCPRSGTTLLQLMLHAHPRTALPPETSFVLPAYEGRLAFGDLRDAGSRAGLARWITGRKETRFHGWGWTPTPLSNGSRTARRPSARRSASRSSGALDVSRAASWQQRLTPDQIRLCDAVLGQRLARHGYELTGAVRPDPAELLRYRKVSALRRPAEWSAEWCSHPDHAGPDGL
ncbi:sulfotransferase [Streptomyces sp. P17]|uniref:sulfotransferase family protein n=1 Tax=Streptomyces sp. P17 TaxID=3074716 RepID=UPI0028F4295B|nr:sulfotransferase [Streptomyces sp. P17]MDT9696009.1 sulfotransferase [Streptomyces sp. P17]